MLTVQVQNASRRFLHSARNAHMQCACAMCIASNQASCHVTGRNVAWRRWPTLNKCQANVAHVQMSQNVILWLHHTVT